MHPALSLVRAGPCSGLIEPGYSSVSHRLATAGRYIFESRGGRPHRERQVVAGLCEAGKPYRPGSGDSMRTESLSGFAGQVKDPTVGLPGRLRVSATRSNAARRRSPRVAIASHSSDERPYLTLPHMETLQAPHNRSGTPAGSIQKAGPQCGPLSLRCFIPWGQFPSASRNVKAPSRTSSRGTPALRAFG